MPDLWDATKRPAGNHRICSADERQLNLQIAASGTAPVEMRSRAPRERLGNLTEFGGSISFFSVSSSGQSYELVSDINGQANFVKKWQRLMSAVVPAGLGSGSKELHTGAFP